MSGPPLCEHPLPLGYFWRKSFYSMICLVDVSGKLSTPFGLVLLGGCGDMTLIPKVHI
jgi:hypothetical protein